MDIPGAYQAYDGSPPPDPPKRRWARVTYWVIWGVMPYVLAGLMLAIAIGFLHTEVRWQWKWHAAGAVVVMLVTFTGFVIWRRRKAWDQTLVRRRAAKACPACGYDLIDVVHPPTSPGIPGQVARCPECGRGVRYIEPDPEMEELARAHSRRNDAATDNAIASSRTAINGAISGGENASA